MGRGAGLKQTLQPCVLCLTLKEETENAHNSGEIERERMLKILIKGHVKVCHNLN
jgi:hypothetical protein